MKKILSLLVVAGAMFAVVGCDDAKKPSGSTTKTTTTETKKEGEKK